jgi:hypothetical protein
MLLTFGDGISPLRSLLLQAQYIENTACPVDGWFQPCSSCRAMTGHTLDTGGSDLPICRRCVRDAGLACDIHKAAHTYGTSGLSDTSSDSRGSPAQQGSLSPVESNTSAAVRMISQEDVVWALDWSWWMGACALPRTAEDNNVFSSCEAVTRNSPSRRNRSQSQGRVSPILIPSVIANSTQIPLMCP